MSSIIVNNVRDFARILVQTKELDPIYDFIYNARLVKGQEWADKFALHFFMFYHVGEAAKAANAPDFWFHVYDNYATTKRGTERRHFRGDKGATAIKNLSAMGSPSDIWARLESGNMVTLVNNINYQFKDCQIGPYFAWKAMDLLDRALGYEVRLSLSSAVQFLPDEPRKCCKELWPKGLLGIVLTTLVGYIDDLPAPGIPNRMCSFSEAETILCAVHGYWNKGSYFIGKDITERHMQLAEFPDLLKLLPPNINIRDYERHPLESSILSA